MERYRQSSFLPFFSVVVVVVLSSLFQGCVKDKYDFDKLSTQARLTPSLVMPVVYGTMMVENMVKPNDTIVFDPDGGVRLVYREDSIFTQDVTDIITLDDQDPDTTDFSLGPFDISDATATTDIPNAVGTYALDTLSRFHWVLLSQGTVTVTVRNNLSVQLSSLTLRLRNRDDNSVVGQDLTFTSLASGASQSLSMDVAGARVTNELLVQIVSLSPAVALQSDAFTLTVQTTALEAVAGNAILPEQFLYGDTGIYRVEEDTLQITRLALSRGVFDLQVTTNFPEEVDLEVVFPEARRGGDTLGYAYAVTGGTLNDSLVLDDASFDLSTDAGQPYNTIPYRYLVTMRNSGAYVTFSSADVFHLRYQLRDLTLHYAEGYFGRQTFTFDGDTIETGLDDLFAKIHGTLSLTNPQVRIFYRNGFGISLAVETLVTGVAADGQEQPLNAPVMMLERPADKDAPPVEGVLAFTRDNTDIVPLIDLRPTTILYGGSATVNPDGFTGWDNFVTDSSRLVVGLEVDVPLEFGMQDLRLQDTLENPFEADGTDTSSFSLKDLDYLYLYLGADNGFPLDLSVTMYLYDSLTNVVYDSILFGKIVEAAPVDAGGRVTEPVKTKQEVRIEGPQLERLEQVNALILSVTFNTSGNGSQSVKIYTDYTFGFRLAAATALDYEFDMGD